MPSSLLHFFLSLVQKEHLLRNLFFITVKRLNWKIPNAHSIIWRSNLESPVVMSLPFYGNNGLLMPVNVGHGRLIRISQIPNFEFSRICSRDQQIRRKLIPRKDIAVCLMCHYFHSRIKIQRNSEILKKDRSIRYSNSHCTLFFGWKLNIFNGRLSNLTIRNLLNGRMVCHLEIIQKSIVNSTGQLTLVDSWKIQSKTFIL